MASTLQTTCCIVGGGPAGVMLGYLLARKGVRVTVLESIKISFAISGETRFIRQPWN
jgi:2-polyprenyl-6-methoxyphenol hydroxylase-like FAD-dependent oxidoreductase